MEKSWGMIFLALCFLTTALFAQGPCTNIKSHAVLLKGKSYTITDCDTLLAVHPSFLQRFRDTYAEVERLKTIDTLNQDLKSQYEETMATYDSMILELKGFISVQDTAINKFDKSLIHADSLLAQSTKNTDRALEEISKERMKGRLLMLGGILAGTITGYFLGKGL